MLTIPTATAMQRQVQAWRQAGQTIAFVPTMGALHEGHMSLVRAARARAAKMVVSIFVNPTQFGPNEDLAKYPRTLEADLAQCRTCGVDAVFTPSAEEIYPPGDQTIIEVTALSQPLCGPFRPGHFRGVATVVYKLFAIVLPHIALFGEKDYQQWKVIERMTRDLRLPVTIVGMPTVREPDGLAMSSRNQYLSPAERVQACAIVRALQRAQAVARETKDTVAITAAMMATLHDAGITNIQYATLVDAETLQEVPGTSYLGVTGTCCRACVAAYVGTTRLIDNMAISA